MRKLLLAGALAVVASACGGIGQSEQCKRYIACTEAVTPGGSTSLNPTYGPSGTCWTTNQASADACTAACKSAADALKANNMNQTACQ